MRGRLMRSGFEFRKHNLPWDGVTQGVRRRGLQTQLSPGGYSREYVGVIIFTFILYSYTVQRTCPWIIPVAIFFKKHFIVKVFLKQYVQTVGFWPLPLDHRSRILYLIRKLYIVGKSQLGGNLLINTAVFLKECQTVVCQTESIRLSL